MLVWFTDGWPYLVVDHELVLECLVREEQGGGHASCLGECHNEWPDELVEAFVDIYAASSDFDPRGSLELYIKLCVVPSFFSPCPWYTGIHGLISSCADPWGEVSYANRSPQSV